LAGEQRREAERKRRQETRVANLETGASSQREKAYGAKCAGAAKEERSSFGAETTCRRVV